MSSFTSAKTLAEIPLTSAWKTVLTKIPIVGSSGEAIDVKYWFNVDGLVAPGVVFPYGVVLDFRYLRNSITNEDDPGFDETGGDTYNPNARYQDKATGLPYWKQWASDDWFFTKNASTFAVQARVYNAKNCVIKAGAFGGSTDKD